MDLNVNWVPTCPVAHHFFKYTFNKSYCQPASGTLFPPLSSDFSEGTLQTSATRRPSKVKAAYNKRQKEDFK